MVKKRGTIKKHPKPLRGKHTRKPARHASQLSGVAGRQKRDKTAKKSLHRKKIYKLHASARKNPYRTHAPNSRTFISLQPPACRRPALFSKKTKADLG